jgi:hypothetical protein
MSNRPPKDVLAKIKQFEQDRLKQEYQAVRDARTPPSAEPEPEMLEFLDERGFLPGEERAATRALQDSDDAIGEKIDNLAARSGVRSGPKPHYARGGDEGWVIIPPSPYEWRKWAEKHALEAEQFDAELGQPKPPQETFRQKYWRQHHHEWEREQRKPSDLVNPEGQMIRLRDDARLETPPADMTPEQMSARERFAARLNLRRRRTHSEVAKSQTRDSAGRFAPSRPVD